MDKRIKSFILDINKLARDTPLTEYKQAAFHLLQQVIHFDSGIWNEGHWIAGDKSYQPNIYTQFLFNHSPQMCIDHVGFIEFDEPLRQAVTQSLGVTIDFNDVIPRGEFVRTPTYQQYYRKFGMEWIISTALLDSELGLTRNLSLHRKDRDKPFSEADRTTKEILTPFLVDGYQTCFRLAVLQGNRAGLRATSCIALAGENGVIEYAHSSWLLEMAQIEPTWKGPRVPNCFSDLFPSDGYINTAKRKLAIHGLDSGLSQLEIIPINPLGVLSAQQCNVAKAVGRGLSRKEAGKELRLSPSTVGNHLDEIYRRLGIKNKAELATLVSTHLS